MSAIPEPFGQRLLPNILKQEADAKPERVFAVYTNSDSDDLTKDSFVEVTFRQIKQAVDHVANWLQSSFDHDEKLAQHETLAFIGIPDLRYNIFFYAAIQCRCKVFLPSPRNPAAVNLSLLKQMDCTKVFYTAEVAPIAESLKAAADSHLSQRVLPSLEELLTVPPSKFVYDLRFADVSNEPVLVLHSSGSTGLPKPVTSTHGTLASSDVREYETVPGHANHDGVNAFCFPDGRIFDIFPPFHLAGFVLKLVIPLFNLTPPVFGPSTRPPSGSLVAEIIRRQKPSAVCLPPSLIEQLYHESDGLSLLKDLKILGFAGGPLSSSIGNEVSRHTQLFQFYGSTEAGQMRQVKPLPEDWEYYQFHPIESFEFQSEGDGSFELVLFPSEAIAHTSHLYNNYPDIREWRTKDLFLPHPSKPDLWKFHARKDDILVLSSGEKLNPIPIESYIAALEGVNGALVVGSRRPQAALLVEMSDNSAVASESDHLDKLWPKVEEANALVPAHGRIAKSKILIAADKSFKRAGKGTVIRRLTEVLFDGELQQLYASNTAASETDNVAPLLLKPSLFGESDINALTRSILGLVQVTGFVSDQENLFNTGLDSVKTLEVMQSLKKSLRPHVKSQEELNWITPEVLFRNPTIEKLSAVLLQFLNHGVVPQRKDRGAEIQATIQKFTSDLPSRSSSLGEENGVHSEKFSVAVTGTTGYLGFFLLRQLLQNPKTSRIYALNRSAAAAESFEERNGSRSDFTIPLEFFTVDLAREDLGLAAEKYAEIQSCHAILHNAWRVDFNLPLSSFEDNIHSLRNLIDLSAKSSHAVRPRIFFISSIAATGVWAPEGSARQTVPAGILDDPEKPIRLGYGESKYVAEHLLREAAEKAAVPFTILRTGQIYPSSEPQDNDTWPPNDSMGIFLSTCKALQALPSDFLEELDGVPVDWVVKIMNDVVTKETLAYTDEYRVFNLVHPKPAS